MKRKKFDKNFKLEKQIAESLIGVFVDMTPKERFCVIVPLAFYIKNKIVCVTKKNKK
jgi:hypothetical protein